LYVVPEMVYRIKPDIFEKNKEQKVQVSDTRDDE